MDNILEIHDGNFHLTIHLGKLHELPIPNYRRLLRKYPDAMKPLGAYLRGQVSVCKAEWDRCSREFANGWRIADPHSRTPENRAKLSENKRLEKNLSAAKHTYEAYKRLLQIYENQGGTHT